MGLKREYGTPRWNISTVTASTGEPVTLDEMKLALRVDREQTDEHAYIQGLTRAATTVVESMSGRTLLQTTLRWSMDRVEYWTDPDTAMQFLRVPRPPLKSVSSITYVDSTGVTTTWASSNYSVDTYSEPGRITLVYGGEWPTIRQQANSVQVQFIAGASTTTGIDEAYKTAIKLLADHWYNHRAAVDEIQLHPVPMAVEALLAATDYGKYHT